MSLPTVNKKLDRYREHIKNTLSEIELTLDLPKKDWLDIIGVLPRQYQRIMKGIEDLSIQSLYQLTENLNISCEAFEKGSLDFDALREHWNKNFDYIPERYTLGAFSKRHSVLNVLDFVETTRGRAMRHHINRSLQTNDSIWKKIDQPINIFYITDALDILAKRGYTKAEFIAMGRNSFTTLRGTPLGNQIAAHSNLKNLYEFMFEGFSKSFEQNTDYKIIALTRSKCVFQSRISLRLSDTLKIKDWGNSYACVVKAGITGSFSCFFGLPPSQVTETRCIQSGDACCEFEVIFPIGYPAPKPKPGNSTFH